MVGPNFFTFCLCPIALLLIVGSALVVGGMLVLETGFPCQCPSVSIFECGHQHVSTYK